MSRQQLRIFITKKKKAFADGPRTAVVHAAGAEGEELVGAADGEVEALVVVVGVRVRGAAGGGAGPDVVAGSVGRSVDLGGRVVGAAAGSGALLQLVRGSSLGDDGQQGDEDGGQVHFEFR